MGKPTKLDPEVARLMVACEDLAEFVEEQYRKMFLMASKREIDRQVREHALLAPVREALAALRKRGY